MKTVKGTLQHGFVINGKAYRNFEMRPATVGDMMDAEEESDVRRPISFNCHLIIQQLVNVDGFTGPFTIGMIRALPPEDYGALRAAQAGANPAGESTGSDSPS